MSGVSEKLTRIFAGCALFALSLPYIAQEAIAAQQPRQQPQQQSSRREQYRDQAQTTLEDQQHRDMESVPGMLSEKYGKFYLQQAHSKVNFQLADLRDAKRYIGKKVRVSGWLDSEHNIFHVVTIANAR